MMTINITFRWMKYALLYSFIVSNIKNKTYASVAAAQPAADGSLKHVGLIDYIFRNTYDCILIAYCSFFCILSSCSNIIVVVTTKDKGTPSKPAAQQAADGSCMSLRQLWYIGMSTHCHILIAHCSFFWILSSCSYITVVVTTKDKGTPSKAAGQTAAQS